MKVVLAGTGSAVGKTTISTGIMKALSKKDSVQPFKVGPDYIDPTYHTMATGNTSINLDSFFMNEDQIRTSFNNSLKKSNSKIGIIEGVRGLYEGISPISDVGNTASIAKALDAPIILIMDARSLVKSAAAIVLGFKTLDPELKIQGVILNKVKGKKHYLKTKESIEKLTDTKVLGAIPRDDEIATKERHLGLVPALENEQIAINIERWGQITEENIDLDALKVIMKESPKVKSSGELWKIANKTPVKIGVAKDEIFTFYYHQNLQALEDNNAKIIQFSPYKDEKIPDVDALYIGGGYPEVFKKELEQNQSMRNSIKQFYNNDNPIYGECGGLIYLSKTIDHMKMCDVINYDAIMTPKVQGLSYVIAEVTKDNLIANKGEIIKGHEFHYTKLLNGENANFSLNITRGTGISNFKDGIISKNTLANYLHVHACAHKTFAYNFTRNIAEEN
ncbi:Ni-sirohydrochlorin a,c-diamide synthase [Methanobrevibacter filiformis]|uniref:Cobyrinate a,c-diamide synthase n=1 Tax=Methanobrevibacter filiformis TaxID=55758 RepID=A0A166EST7_9EURY|nr:Ni-sirohydrochlorin a,c-diamide synthase [Methanobrevibacter filiformis]KZX16971.1 cobyrinic acid A,C-diamide synthase [Methanobrevibacter filiformis]